MFLHSGQQGVWGFLCWRAHCEVVVVCGWLKVASACEQDESGLSSDMLVYPLLQCLCIRKHIQKQTYSESNALKYWSEIPEGIQLSLRILQYVKGVKIRVELSINFNIMQPDYGYGIVVQLVHHFLLPANFAALENINKSRGTGLEVACS